MGGNLDRFDRGYCGESVVSFSEHNSGAGQQINWLAKYLWFSILLGRILFLNEQDQIYPRAQ